MLKVNLTRREILKGYSLSHDQVALDIQAIILARGAHSLNTLLLHVVL